MWSLKMLNCFQQRKKRIHIIFLPNSMGFIYKDMKERVPFFSYLSQWFHSFSLIHFILSCIYLFFCSIFYSFVYSSIYEPTEQILCKCLPYAMYCYRYYAVVQPLSCVQVFVTPRTAMHQVSLSLTVAWSVLKLMFIELWHYEYCNK